jgi:anti-anti-sigma factor
MKIDFEQRGKYLLILVEGRLDASWADYFTDTLLLQIRKGQHHLVLDASEMVFLSSAGIRALLQVFKELNTVRGHFCIVNPTSFVEQTLSTSGFQMWLEKEFPDDMPAAGDAGEKEASGYTGIHRYIINENAVLKVSKSAGWQPWQVIDEGRVQTLTCYRDTCALGIGSAAATFDDARNHFGEFLAVAGNVVYQSPDEQALPDYLIAEKRFLPRMQCIQALNWSGEMKHLFRFAPTDSTLFYPVSALLTLILEQTGGKAAGFVILGEIEGMVGTALIRSPGRISEDREIIFPEIREWLTFCGERSFSHQQALLVGIVSVTSGSLIPLIPSALGKAAHIHAAVFPYQPLPNGKIELAEVTGKFFNGPSPLAVMHLTEDDRPVVGLGESTLVRGACWCGPFQNPEVLL